MYTGDLYFLVLSKTNQQFPVCENVLSFISLEKAQNLTFPLSNYVKLFHSMIMCIVFAT